MRKSVMKIVSNFVLLWQHYPGMSLDLAPFLSQDSHLASEEKPCDEEVLKSESNASPLQLPLLELSNPLAADASDTRKNNFVALHVNVQAIISEYLINKPIHLKNKALYSLKVRALFLAPICDCFSLFSQIALSTCTDNGVVEFIGSILSYA